MMPGTRLMQFACRWFSPAVVSSVFEPLVADWQREWQAAPRASRPTVRARGAAAFVFTTLCLTPRIVLAPLPRPLSRRPLTRVLLFCAAGVVIQAGLTYANWRQASLPVAAWALLIPSLVTMMLPFGVVAGVDAIRCHEPWPEHIERRAAFKLLAVVTLWMIIGGGWLVPAMNQRWRNALDSANAGQLVAPLTSVSELSTYKLLVTDDHVHPMTAMIHPGDRRRELENRLAMAVLPFLLVGIRWRFLNLGSSRWFAPLPLIVIGVSSGTGAILLRALPGDFWAGSSTAPHLAVWSTVVLVQMSSVVGQQWTERRARSGGAR